ncbi:MAG: hypothetical protein J6Q85_02425 [Clostridia bacterium]|nr:hypothetical protein [Clostridia bacterium]
MKNKKQQQTPERRGISTKGYKPNGASGQSVEQDRVPAERKLSKKSKIIIAVISAVLSLALILGTVFTIILALEEQSFDYLTSDLSKYIEISDEDYKGGFELRLNISKPRAKGSDGSGISDVENRILYILSQGIKNKVVNNGARYSSGTIALGDDVYIRYRGYTVEDGKQIDVIGLHNYYLDTNDSGIFAEGNAINVGSGTVPFPGFEAGLIGKNTADYATLTKITDRAATASDIVYISADRVKAGTSVTEVGRYVRIDLSLAENQEWKDILVGRKPSETIPDFNIILDGAEYTYKSAQINFITEGERADNVLVVESYVPESYTGDASMIGKTVYFDVFVEGIVYHNEWHNDQSSDGYTLDYDFNDGYITDALRDGTLGIDADELNTYEGVALTEKYENYIYKTLYGEYEKKYSELLELAVWDYFFDKARVKKYPKLKVEEIYNLSLSSMTQSFVDSEGYIYNQYSGYNQMCESIDEYAVIYLDLVYAENQDWRSVLYSEACDLVKERLILYYILKEENALPSASELDRAVDTVKDEFVEAYIEMDKTDTSGYTDEKYKEYVDGIRDKINSAYTSSYFKERAYAKLALECVLEYASVKTLGE